MSNLNYAHVPSLELDLCHAKICQMILWQAMEEFDASSFPQTPYSLKDGAERLVTGCRKY